VRTWEISLQLPPRVVVASVLHGAPCALGGTAGRT